MGRVMVRCEWVLGEGRGGTPLALTAAVDLHVLSHQPQALKTVGATSLSCRATSVSALPGSAHFALPCLTALSPDLHVCLQALQALEASSVSALPDAVRVELEEIQSGGGLAHLQEVSQQIRVGWL